MENPEMYLTYSTGRTKEEADAYLERWQRFLTDCREEWLAGKLDLTAEEWPCKWCGEAFHSEGLLASHYYKEHHVSPSSFPITPRHYLENMTMESEWEEGREDDSGQSSSPTGMETKARPGQRGKSRPAAKGFPCKRCQEVFSSVKTLASHFSRVHGTSQHTSASTAVSSPCSSATDSSPSSSATDSSTTVYSKSARHRSHPYRRPEQ